MKNSRPKLDMDIDAINEIVRQHTDFITDGERIDSMDYLLEGKMVDVIPIMKITRTAPHQR